jgi:hypothetical protein
MAIEARLRELGSRHQTLEKVIEEEARRPSNDSLRVHPTRDRPRRGSAGKRDFQNGLTV